ncbi:MAG: hypothetical protein ABFD97_14285 [Syntrophobacter sp.]
MAKTIILALVMLISAGGFISPAWADRPTAQENVEAVQFSMNDEQFGGLRIGLTEKELTGNIACKPKKGKELLEGATGDYVQTWKYPGCGIELKMGSDKKGGAKRVASITLTSPASLMTKAGIHIGSTEGEVIKAYGKYRDRDGGTRKGKRFVAGSIYDGLIFLFRNGKVTEIFLGAAAE